MKTFEENFTAWVDGKLTGAELAAFERELASMEIPEAEKAAANRLGSLLREHLVAPKLANADFFNHQLLQQIESEKLRTEVPARRAFFWTLPRMAWAGACCLLLASALYFVTVPKTQREVAADQEYVANILNAHADDPGVSATAYHDKDQNVTVLWLEGLPYIPADRALK